MVVGVFGGGGPIGGGGEYRGQGVGSRLLGFAERYAGPAGMSLVVTDVNTGARRLYERVGYRVTARRAMVPDIWDFSGDFWILMQKPAA